MSTTRRVGPATEPITTAEARTHVHIDGAAHDTYLDTLIAATREWIEEELNRSLITQTWQTFLHAFPSENFITLRYPPLLTITHLKYVDADGDSTTWGSSNYLIDLYSTPGRLVLEDGISWPSDTLRPANGVEVEFTAGYGAASAVPARLKHLQKMLLGHWFANREAYVVGTISSEIGHAVERLAWQSRVLEV